MFDFETGTSSNSTANNSRDLGYVTDHDIEMMNMINLTKSHPSVTTYNDEGSALLRNDMVHSPTLTSRSGVENQPINVLPVSPSRSHDEPEMAAQNGWHDTDI